MGNVIGKNKKKQKRDQDLATIAEQLQTLTAKLNEPNKEVASLKSELKDSVSALSTTLKVLRVEVSQLKDQVDHQISVSGAGSDSMSEGFSETNSVHNPLLPRTLSRKGSMYQSTSRLPVEEDSNNSTGGFSWLPSFMCFWNGCA